MFFSIMSVGFHVFDHPFPGINTAGSTYLYACVFLENFQRCFCIVSEMAIHSNTKYRLQHGNCNAGIPFPDDRKLGLKFSCQNYCLF